MANDPAENDGAYASKPIARRRRGPPSQPASSGPRRRKSAKAPDAPKRPLSAYNIFFRDQREEIVEEHSQGILSDDMKQAMAISQQQYQTKKDQGLPTKRMPGLFESLAKVIGKRWKALAKEERERYQELARQDMARYHKETEAYHQKLMAKSIKAAGASEVREKQVEPVPNEGPSGMIAAGSQFVAGSLGQYNMDSYNMLGTSSLPSPTPLGVTQHPLQPVPHSLTLSNMDSSMRGMEPFQRVIYPMHGAMPFSGQGLGMPYPPTEWAAEPSAPLAAEPNNNLGSWSQPPMGFSYEHSMPPFNQQQRYAPQLPRDPYWVPTHQSPAFSNNAPIGRPLPFSAPGWSNMVGHLNASAAVMPRDGGREPKEHHEEEPGGYYPPPHEDDCTNDPGAATSHNYTRTW